MDAAQVRAQLRQFIVQNYLFGDASGVPQGYESLLESGVLDSTGVLELIEFLETDFEISVEDNETVPENLDSIDNLTAFVLRKATGG